MRSIVLTLGSGLLWSAALAAQEPPLFVQAYVSGPIDSIYNAEYQRVQTACRGRDDACYEAELDTTAVRLAPIYSAPDGTVTGWLAARLRPRGAYPYAGLIYESEGGDEVPLVGDLGDWGYGAYLDLVEARDGWIRPWLLESAGDYWISPDGGPGFGIVEGPYGLEGRLWRLGPVEYWRYDPSRSGRRPTDELVPEGVYMILAVHDGVVSLRPELPSDMDCGEPTDTSAIGAPPQVIQMPLQFLLDASGRTEVEVAYPRGC